jgi:asparagine synthase (glutamine-hydrolysing)
MPSYTYSGAYRDCYDIKIARDVAASCGQRHQVISLGPEFFRNFSTLAEETVWATDGCLDLCGTHEIYFSKQARRLSPVRLTGNYGSEVLRSVSTFKFNPPPSTLFDPAAVAATRAAGQSLADIRAPHPVTFAAFQEIAWNLFGRLAAAQSQLTLRAHSRQQQHFTASDRRSESPAGRDPDRHGLRARATHILPARFRPAYVSLCAVQS